LCATHRKLSAATGRNLDNLLILNANVRYRGEPQGKRLNLLSENLLEADVQPADADLRPLI
jgi:hypothetical protein